MERETDKRWRSGANMAKNHYTNDAKQWWIDCVSCSEAGCTIIDRGFGAEQTFYEQAAHLLSGGLGLAGNGCGALAAGGVALTAKHYVARGSTPRDSRLRAAIQELGLSPGFRHASNQLLEGFRDRFGSELCLEITGHRFESIEEHSNFIAQGGCGNVIEFVAEAVSGWKEPGQTAEFDEYTVVLNGSLHIHLHDDNLDVKAGQAIIIHSGEWVQYSTPSPEGAKYIAVCLPAFSPNTVKRD